MKNNKLFGVILVAVILGITGCGGGGGTPPPPTQKTAVLSFSVMSSSRLPSRIEGIQLTAVLPPGVTVVTETASTAISISALTTGAATPNSHVYGSYSAAGQKVKLVVAQVNPGFGPGEFARLTCNVVPGKTLTETDFSQLFTVPPVYFKATYYDSVPGNNVDLYPVNLKAPAIKVTFTY